MISWERPKEFFKGQLLWYKEHTFKIVVEITSEILDSEMIEIKPLNSSSIFWVKRERLVEKRIK